MTRSHTYETLGRLILIYYNSLVYYCNFVMHISLICAALAVFGKMGKLVIEIRCVLVSKCCYE